MTFTADLLPIIPPPALRHLQRRVDQSMRRPPDEIIGDRYLRRWHSTKSPVSSLYLHLYVGNDPVPWPHDHPWPSFSLCLRGVIRETCRTSDGQRRSTTISAGTFSYRPASFAHRLGLVVAPAVTIFLTGPHLREWGWYLPGGWCHWSTVSGLDPDGVTRTHTPAPVKKHHGAAPNNAP